EVSSVANTEHRSIASGPRLSSSNQSAPPATLGAISLITRADHGSLPWATCAASTAPPSGAPPGSPQPPQAKVPSAIVTPTVKRTRPNASNCDATPIRLRFHARPSTSPQKSATCVADTSSPGDGVVTQTTLGYSPPLI